MKRRNLSLADNVFQALVVKDSSWLEPTITPIDISCPGNSAPSGTTFVEALPGPAEVRSVPSGVKPCCVNVKLMSLTPDIVTGFAIPDSLFWTMSSVSLASQLTLHFRPAS